MSSTTANFETRDKKPLIERKTDDRGPVRPAGSADQYGVPVAMNERGDANAIGSPDVFLADRHRELPKGTHRIHQVWADGVDRGYVISEGSKLGYFELTEGMPRPEAEAALAGAYDGTAVVL